MIYKYYSGKYLSEVFVEFVRLKGYDETETIKII